MSDETEAPEVTEGDTDDGAQEKTVPKSELDRAVAKRQQAKAEREEALKELAQLRAEKKKAEDQRLRDAEDWGELEKRMKAEKDEVTAQLAERDAKIEGILKAQRHSALVDAVAKATGREAQRDSLRRMMLGAEAEGRQKDLDWAPGDLTDKAVDKVARFLKKIEPDFFKQQARGGTPGAIGSPLSFEDMDKEQREKWAFELGRKMSGRSKKE